MTPRSAATPVLTLPLFLLLVLFPLMLFAHTAQEVWSDGGFAFDQPTLLFIHRSATPALDKVMVIISSVAGVVALPIITFAVAAVFWFRHQRRWTVFLLLAVGGTSLLDLTLKATFHRVRPHLWVSPAPQTDYGFPSGHSITSISFFLALLMLAWPTRFRWPTLVLGLVGTLLIGLSRLYLGVHYPSNVIAAWAAGVVWTVGVYRLLFWHHPLKRDSRPTT